MKQDQTIEQEPGLRFWIIRQIAPVHSLNDISWADILMRSWNDTYPLFGIRFGPDAPATWELSPIRIERDYPGFWRCYKKEFSWCYKKSGKRQIALKRGTPNEAADKLQRTGPTSWWQIMTINPCWKVHHFVEVCVLLLPITKIEILWCDIHVNEILWILSSLPALPSVVPIQRSKNTPCLIKPKKWFR